MQEEVKVVDTKPDEIIVGCDKSACQGCHSSFFCNKKTSTFEVLNPKNLDLKSGDKVILDIPSGKTVFSILFSLAFPLVLFFPGYYIGKFFTENELVLALFGLGFIRLGFSISGRYFKVRKKRYAPVVTRKVEEIKEEASES